jgi:hypothetical protein
VTKRLVDLRRRFAMLRTQGLVTISLTANEVSVLAGLLDQACQAEASVLPAGNLVRG